MVSRMMGLEFPVLVSQITQHCLKSGIETKVPMLPPHILQISCYIFAGKKYISIRHNTDVFYRHRWKPFHSTLVRRAPTLPGFRFWAEHVQSLKSAQVRTKLTIIMLTSDTELQLAPWVDISNSSISINSTFLTAILILWTIFSTKCIFIICILANISGHFLTLNAANQKLGQNLKSSVSMKENANSTNNNSDL